jgi:hypothetical protein
LFSTTFAHAAYGFAACAGQQILKLSHQNLGCKNSILSRQFRYSRNVNSANLPFEKTNLGEELGEEKRRSMRLALVKAFFRARHG